jgi:hypothetical protein
MSDSENIEIAVDQVALLTEAIVGLQITLQEGFAEIKGGFAEIKGGFAEMKEGFAETRSDLNELKQASIQQGRNLIETTRQQGQHIDRLIGVVELMARRPQ